MCRFSTAVSPAVQCDCSSTALTAAAVRVTFSNYGLSVSTTADQRLSHAQALALLQSVLYTAHSARPTAAFVMRNVTISISDDVFTDVQYTAVIVDQNNQPPTLDFNGPAVSDLGMLQFSVPTVPVRVIKVWCNFAMVVVLNSMVFLHKHARMHTSLNACTHPGWVRKATELIVSLRSVKCFREAFLPMFW